MTGYAPGGYPGIEGPNTGCIGCELPYLSGEGSNNGCIGCEIPYPSDEGEGPNTDCIGCEFPYVSAGGPKAGCNGCEGPYPGVGWEIPVCSCEGSDAICGFLNSCDPDPGVGKPVCRSGNSFWRNSAACTGHSHAEGLPSASTYMAQVP